MLLTRFAPVAFAALAIGAVDVEKRQNDGSYDTADLADLAGLASLAGISTLPTDPAKIASIESAIASLTAILPPDSILSVLETAVPASVISDLSNPVSASAFASAFEVGNYPAWYSNLPNDVKNFFSTYSPTLAMTNNAAVTTDRDATGQVTDAITPASTNTAQGGANPTSPRSLSVTQMQSGTPTRASDNGAPRQTAALAAGAFGVIGVLGLAVGL